MSQWNKRQKNIVKYGLMTKLFTFGVHVQGGLQFVCVCVCFCLPTFPSTAKAIFSIDHELGHTQSKPLLCMLAEGCGPVKLVCRTCLDIT